MGTRGQFLGGASPEGGNGNTLADGQRKRGFAQQDLGPGAVDLHLDDVVDVGRYYHLALLVVPSFNLEGIQCVDVSLGVDYAPGGRRGVGHLEVGRNAQNTLAVFDSMGHGSVVALWSFELRRGLGTFVGD